MIVINKSTQNILFKIGAEKVLIVGGNVLNTIKDETWDALYAKYKGYFDKRRFSDKNPTGCFSWQNKRENAKAEQKELNFSETVDNGKQMTLDEALALEFDGMTLKQLTAYADENGIPYRKNCKKKELLDLIYSAEKAKKEQGA